MRINLAQNRTNVIYLEVVIFLLLSIVYYYIIKDVYGYMGFSGVPKIANILIGWGAFIFLLLLSSRIKNEFFYTIWHITFILYVFGQIIYYQYDGVSIKPLLAHTLNLIILFFASFIKWNFKIYTLKVQYLGMAVMMSTILFFPILVKYYSFVDLNNLILQNVYDTRHFFRNFDDPYFGYVRAPLSRVILPSILLIAIYKRRILLALLSIFMIVFIFLVGALKSVFIGMFAAILFYYGKNYISKLYILIYLFFGLTLFGLLVFVLSENTFLINSFVRRILFIPPLLDNYYYDTFENLKTLWSHNLFGELLFDYPFNKPPNMYVGETILQHEGMSANVGVITEGYFSFGFVGVILHSIFTAFLFIILKQINVKPIFFGIVFVYIYYINTSFITILLLTHGLLFFVIFAYLFLNKDYD